MSATARRAYAAFVLTYLVLLTSVSYARGTPQASTADQAAEGLPSAALGTAFTYQGQLQDGGAPANGAYDFQFILYDASVGGSQVGPIVTADDLPVSEGLFSASLDFGAVFDGTALWLEIGVRDGNSGGAYTILSPRQPLTGAPYALGLLPGAVITGTVPGPALTLSNTGGDGVHVVNAGNDGVEVGTTNGAGVRVVNAGGHGVNVENAASNGIRVLTSGTNGVAVVAAGTNGVRVVDAGQDGLSVGDAAGSGLNIDHAGGDGIFICATGTETSCTPSGSSNGIEIGAAEDSGIRVNSAGTSGVSVGSAVLSGVDVFSAELDGVLVFSAGRYGVYLVSAMSDGVHVNSAGGDGVDVAGDNLAGYFRGDISVTGSCTGCTLAMFGFNAGNETLQPGDLVTALGTQAILNDSTPMLLELAPAKAGQTVVGLVGGWAELVTEDNPRPTEVGLRLIPREGPAEPGAYVTIIYHGPVQVRADALAGTIAPGARLTLGEGGGVRALHTTEVNGLTVAESVPVVGIALSEPDATGLVWVLLSPQ